MADAVEAVFRRRANGEGWRTEAMPTINDKPPAAQASDRLCSRGSERKKAARKRAKRTPIATENNGAVDPAKQLRPLTTEDIANEQTAEQLALRIWAAMVAQKVLSGMSALMDELIESHLLDDDDEEADEGWLDDHRKREKTILDEAIVDALDKYPDFNAINNLPRNPDPDIASDAEQLREVLTRCAIGATKFTERFPRAQLEQMVRRDLKARIKKDPRYGEHVRGDVPGADVKAYGGRGRTSSKGTFAKAADYESGGGLAALFTGGWMRVAKDRIDPVAWSHQFDVQRKTEKQQWRHHFLITERNGKQSAFELPRETLAGTGASAIRLLMKGGIHVVGRDVAQKALVQFLRFKPRGEIIRMPRVGWAPIGSHWIFVRPDEVITPAGMPMPRGMSYVSDRAATCHGDALALARTDLGLPLDEITLANPRTAEAVIYKVASGTKGPRATSTGHLRETAHASVLVLSTGEKSLAEFIGRSLQKGARKRLVDIPAEVQPGSAFETIPRELIHIESERLFDAMKRHHGAVGRDWQRHLVNVGPDKIKAELHEHREAFLALPEGLAVAEKAHPQVRAVVNRFALYAAALRMAIAAGLLPWSVEEADAGIAACTQRWVTQRGNVDTAGEVMHAARQVERELVSGLGERFIHIRRSGTKWMPVSEADEFRQRTPELFDGYVKPDRILVRTEAWRRFCNGVDPAEIARHFQQRGSLIADDNGVSKAEQVIGKVERFYVLSRAALTL